ncbi:MAG: DHH family phosphoesterase [Oscillospiraceae bacterium]|nr:DHH family phosphoesterase [Oscillospiraceae bacterium]
MDKKLGRLLRPHVGAYLLMLLGFGIAAAMVGEYVLAGLELGITLLLFVIYLMRRAREHTELQGYLQKYTEEMAGLQGNVTAPFPTLVINLADGSIVFANREFRELMDIRDTFVKRTVSEFVPEFDTDWITSGKTEYPAAVNLGKKRFRVYGSAFRGEDKRNTPMGVLFFSDLTELYEIRDEYIRSRPVVSIVLVDNYDELTRNMSEAAISGMNARINNTIMKWAQSYHGLLRRLEKNRFLLVFEKRDLKKAVAGKFSLLEDVHGITSPAGLEASVSIGLGVDGATFEESYEFAALSIEMALSRGGDQAVVKDRLNFRFYGGRNKESEHRSRVRSRVTANSLLELIGQSSQIFIMGHKNADMDSVGAAMGIASLCRKKGKPFYIVLDLENNAADKLLDEIRQEPEYKDVFITGQEALVRCDNRSTLVVVDTNRPDQVESQPLLEAIPKVCVVDHHLRASDYIHSVVVNFHEPFASSAAEMVTELLEYGLDRNDILPIEAKALMAGIFLDTKNFNVRTGERTFEAAAYLSQLGADTVEVKKLLQSDFQNTVAKHQIIKAARLYNYGIAIAALSTTTSRTLAAQAADELLNISGITASFVLYPDGDRVIISARSIGKANVQVILEPLGGGGNTATAGAQVSGSTVKDVLDRLTDSIDKFFEE